MELEDTQLVYGFYKKLNEPFAEKWYPIFMPPVHGWKQFVKEIIRYLYYYVPKVFRGHVPVFDVLSLAERHIPLGVPLGAIGSGSIGRGIYGEFCHFQILPGDFEQKVCPSAQFILSVHSVDGELIRHQVLTAQAPPSDGSLSRWNWDFPTENISYRGLYPRSWTHYRIPDIGLDVCVRQISPVLPHNYNVSCLPCAVFVWSLKNSSAQAKYVTITFTMSNDLGFTNPVEGETGSFTRKCSGGSISGKTIRTSVNSVTDITLAIASTCLGESHVSITSFDPCGQGTELWDQLKNGLCLNNIEISNVQDVAVAVSSRCLILSNDVRNIETALSWHSPEIRFPESSIIHTRYYSKWFCKKQQAAIDLVCFSLCDYANWEIQIEKWQSPVLEDTDLPQWYKSALFNELHCLTDGGSLWLRHPLEPSLDSTDVRREYGRIALLDSHDTRVYNGFDAQFHWSHVLADLWPNLQLSLQQDILDLIPTVQTEVIHVMRSGQKAIRKRKNVVPKDFGCPGEAPFEKINANFRHDPSSSVDLTLKYVLQVFRDWRIIGNDKFLARTLPTCVRLMEDFHCWHCNSDDVPFHNGDDNHSHSDWVMHGMSAYSSGLWIAALYAVNEMTKYTEAQSRTNALNEMLMKARAIYEKKLWTGTHYKFDSSGSENGDCVMADQLCGIWYLRASGITDEVVGNINKTLETIYRLNVCANGDGKRGALNGMHTDGCVNISQAISEETSPGLTYALGALMIHQGMVEEGFHTVEGIYRAVYARAGCGFLAPGAVFSSGNYRNSGDIRVMSIWTMQKAWQKYKSLRNKHLK